ncbi:DUF1659 domain-containing protein [Bacillus sp. DJP31]|uniref:DUF1659 domain-containing protein n=1 Tax=Bacillus sp. DJP31 TaxID=3409789 RepID=UPI003BB4969F
MAQAFLSDSQLRLVFETGVDEKGKMTTKSKNFNNIKTTATVDNLFAVAQSVFSLQQYPIVGIERNDTNLLGE